MLVDDVVVALRRVLVLVLVLRLTQVQVQRLAEVLSLPE